MRGNLGENQLFIVAFTPAITTAIVIAPATTVAVSVSIAIAPAIAITITIAVTITASWTGHVGWANGSSTVGVIVVVSPDLAGWTITARWATSIFPFGPITATVATRARVDTPFS